MAAASPKKNVPDHNVLASAVRLLPLMNHSSCRRYSQQQPFIEKLVKNLHRVQQSAEETTQKWVRTLLASNNPVLRFYLALRADYCNFLQIRCRNISRSDSIAAHNFAAILPGDSLAGLVVTNGISNFLNLYNTLLVVRLVLTWFPSVPPAIVSPLSTICDPYLNIFRGLIPPLGGTLDLSPILAFLVLNAFTSTAAALPAELPPSMSSSVYNPSSGPASGNITSVQTLWLKRLGNGRSK